MMKITSLLMLLALPCLATAQFLTDAELSGLAANCKTTAAFSQTSCSDCVYELGGPTSPIQVSGKAWACEGLCQKSIITAPLTSTCKSCIANPATTVYGCEACLTGASTAAIAADCIDCITSNPLVNAPNDYSYMNDAYYTACAACSKMTNDEARTQCRACIATWDAKPLSQGGILTKDEMEHPEVRVNSFGTCVSLANNTQNINTGNFFFVTGMAQNCIPPNYLTVTPPLSPASCIDCLNNVSANNYAGQPAYLRKESGCYSYCQKAPDSPAANLCVTCLKSQFPMDAWACGNCLNPLLNTASCFTCVGNDPYRGRASNYNWACGQCSAITSESLRNLCISCIRSQPQPDFDNPNAAATGIFNQSTEANICSCVDLTLNSTIAINRPLDAMERACFQPHVYYDTNNVLQTPAIPWGNNTNAAGTTSACLGCLAVASANGPNQGLNKKYGCTEYCQDPKLVSGVVQGEACATCVAHPLVADPSGCKMCMTATADNTKRDICFACVESPNDHTNKAWGCAQCAQLGNDAAFDACFQCLALGNDDPCACVDKAKNGTLTSGAQSGCQPNLFRVWLWVDPATPFGSLEWSLDTPTAMAGSSGSLVGSQIIGGVNGSSYTIFTNNLGYNVVGVNLPFEAPPTGVPIGSYIWLSLYKATGPGGALAGVYWDWSQLSGTPGSQATVQWNGVNTFPEFTVSVDSDPSRLAYQLVDSCGNILVDTITRTPYGNTDYSASALGVFRSSVSSSYGKSTQLVVPVTPPDFKVLTVMQHCQGLGALGWQIRLGPGLYDGTALFNAGFAGSKWEASSYLFTVPGYKLQMYRTGDCTGDSLVVTDQVICLTTFPGGWNDQLGCINVTTI